MRGRARTAALLVCSVLWPGLAPADAPREAWAEVVLGVRTLAHPGAEVDPAVTRRRLVRFAEALEKQGIEVVSGHALSGSPLAHLVGEDPVGAIRPEQSA